ncbi:MAG: hypothetical protein ACREE0_08790 [Phenylobacterium sp.]
MVQLNFNMQGLVFQDGVNTLRAGFETAVGALRSAWTRAQQDLEAYEAAVEADPTNWIGETEDGHVLWDQSQMLEISIADADEALLALRKAYVIAIYHHWERAARRWTQLTGRADHKVLSAGTLAGGYPVSPRLEAVLHLVNTLKHDSAAKGERLLTAWADVFPDGFAPRARTSWYDAIQLTDAQVLEVCEIVANSGPTVEMVRV